MKKYSKHNYYSVVRGGDCKMVRIGGRQMEIEGQMELV